MDITTIRKKVLANEYSIVTHGLIESQKDGITLQHIETAILNGKIIEDYHQRYRCLIYGTISAEISIHVVCEYYDYLQNTQEDILIVTSYFPDEQQWIKGQIRKR